MYDIFSFTLCFQSIHNGGPLVHQTRMPTSFNWNEISVKWAWTIDFIHCSLCFSFVFFSSLFFSIHLFAHVIYRKMFQKQHMHVINQRPNTKYLWWCKFISLKCVWSVEKPQQAPNLEINFHKVYAIALCEKIQRIPLKLCTIVYYSVQRIAYSCTVYIVHDENFVIFKSVIHLYS